MNDKRKAALGIVSKLAEGFLAGMLISLGGAVFLACVASGTEYGKFIGAFFFSLALVCICMRGYALYTGKIGLLIENHSKDDLTLLVLCLIGNALATVAFGYLIGWIFAGTSTDLKAVALTMCDGKLAQGYGFGFLRAVLCGILVYLSVDIYRNNKTPLGILLCIPAFILSGYEHSIADMFYFAAAGIASWQAVGYLVMIILGNSVGGLLIPVLRLARPKEDKN